VTPVPDPARLRPAHLVLDVSDLGRAAAFWSALLGSPVGAAEAGYCDLAPLGAGGPVLSFQVVRDPKTTKNRLHLDLAADPAAGGVPAAAERARALGATPASEIFDSSTTPWQVWRDPDGNEFCLVTDTTRSPDG
jgi:catechol 2,3-dioxygenase-like lactoylglutathione lyase family enzyme